MAALEHHPKPLEGTRRAAQTYVDGITRSSWWKQNCEPSRIGNKKLMVPTRVLVVEDPDMYGAGTYDHLFRFEGKLCPRIDLGHTIVYGSLRAIEDPWVILHELAHIWDADTPGYHSPSFCYAYHKLVSRYLGEDPAEALKQAMWAYKIRLNYSLI